MNVKDAAKVNIRGTTEITRESIKSPMEDNTKEIKKESITKPKQQDTIEITESVEPITDKIEETKAENIGFFKNIIQFFLNLF